MEFVQADIKVVYKKTIQIITYFDDSASLMYLILPQPLKDN
jgi:hypothetical protein